MTSITFYLQHIKLKSILNKFTFRVSLVTGMSLPPSINSWVCTLPKMSAKLNENEQRKVFSTSPSQSRISCRLFPITYTIIHIIANTCRF